MGIRMAVPLSCSARLTLSVGRFLLKCVPSGVDAAVVISKGHTSTGSMASIILWQPKAEYGHMEVIARSNSPYGPFETPPTDSPDANPFLTNRNLGGYPLQGTGHADLVQDLDGNWWAVLLAFRQIGQYLAFHHLGREVCLVPVHFTEDGWLRAGTDGTVRLTMTGPLSSEPIKQEMMKRLTFSNTSPGMEWVYLRNPFSENYRFLPGDSLQLRGTSVSLDNPDLSPTFLGLRQSEFTGQLQVHLHSTTGEAGISIYQNETHHYELALLQKDGKICWKKVADQAKNHRRHAIYPEEMYSSGPDF